MLFQVSKYAEIFNLIITSLLEVSGNTHIELNHPAFMERQKSVCHNQVIKLSKKCQA